MGGKGEKYVYLSSLSGLCALLIFVSSAVLALLTNRVNDLYIIQVSPFYTLGFFSLALVGLEFAEQKTRKKLRNWFIALFVLISVISIEAKLSLARNAGLQNRVMLDQYLDWRSKLAPDELASGVELVFRDKDLNPKFGKSVFFRSCKEIFLYMPLAIDRGRPSSLRSEVPNYRINMFGQSEASSDFVVPMPSRYLVSFAQNQVASPSSPYGDCSYTLTRLE